MTRNLLEVFSSPCATGLAFQKMLVNALIDRIYLYDDHFLIMLHHSGPKSKAGKDEVREVEHYFGDYSSNESPDGVPIAVIEE